MLKAGCTSGRPSSNRLGAILSFLLAITPVVCLGQSSATTKVNRKDFGVNGASAMVGDDVSIVLDVELTKPAS